MNIVQVSCCAVADTDDLARGRGAAGLLAEQSSRSVDENR
jgi:hypothetical protein